MEYTFDNEILTKGYDVSNYDCVFHSIHDM